MNTAVFFIGVLRNFRLPMFLARSLWPQADFYLLTWDRTQASVIAQKVPLTTELETASKLINFKRVIVYPDTFHPSITSNLARVLFFYQEAARLAAKYQYTTHVLVRPDLFVIPVKPLKETDLDCGDGICMNVDEQMGSAGDQICISSHRSLPFFQNILDRVCERHQKTAHELSQFWNFDKADIHTLLFEELQLQQVNVVSSVHALYGGIICRYDYDPEPFSRELCKRVALDTERWWLATNSGAFYRQNFRIGKKMLFPSNFPTGPIFPPSRK